MSQSTNLIRERKIRWLVLLTVFLCHFDTDSFLPKAWNLRCFPWALWLHKRVWVWSHISVIFTKTSKMVGVTWDSRRLGASGLQCGAYRSRPSALYLMLRCRSRSQHATNAWALHSVALQPTSTHLWFFFYKYYLLHDDMIIVIVLCCIFCFWFIFEKL